MYQQWLQIFYSPMRKIKNQTINKQRKDGKLEISGKEPSPWKVILIPGKSCDIRTYHFFLEKEKKRSIRIMKEAFQERDPKLFREGEDLYKREEKKEEEIKKILDSFRKEEIQMEERLFQAKRNLYLLYRKKRNKKLTENEKKALERASKEVRDITLEHIQQQKNKNFQIQQFTLEPSKIKTEGPVPDIPNIPYLALENKKKIKDLENKKKIKDLENKKKIKELNDQELNDQELNYQEKIINKKKIDEEAEYSEEENEEELEESKE
jgi:hypothetical protein